MAVIDERGGVAARSRSCPQPTYSANTLCSGFTTIGLGPDIHALIDPACAGLPRLIREYHASFLTGSAPRFEDPDHTLEIPAFTLDFSAPLLRRAFLRSVRKIPMKALAL